MMQLSSTIKGLTNEIISVNGGVSQYIVWQNYKTTMRYYSNILIIFISMNRRVIQNVKKLRSLVLYRLNKDWR